MNQSSMIKSYFDIITALVYATLLWFLTTFLSLFLLSGSATVTAYQLIFEIIEDKKALSITQLYYRRLWQNNGFINLWILLIGLFYVGLTIAWLTALERDFLIMLILVLFSGLYLTVFTLQAMPMYAKFQHANAGRWVLNTVLFSWVHGVRSLGLLLLALISLGIILFQPWLFLPSVTFYFASSTMILKPVYQSYEQSLKEHGA